MIFFIHTACVMWTAVSSKMCLFISLLYEYIFCVVGILNRQQNSPFHLLSNYYLQLCSAHLLLLCSCFGTFCTVHKPLVINEGIFHRHIGILKYICQTTTGIPSREASETPSELRWSSCLMDMSILFMEQPERPYLADLIGDGSCQLVL